MCHLCDNNFSTEKGSQNVLSDIEIPTSNLVVLNCHNFCVSKIHDNNQVCHLVHDGTVTCFVLCGFYNDESKIKYYVPHC